MMDNVMLDNFMMDNVGGAQIILKAPLVPRSIAEIRFT